DTRSTARKQKPTHSGPRVYEVGAFLVGEGYLLQTVAVALRAAQVHIVTSCSPTSVWLESFLINRTANCIEPGDSILVARGPTSFRLGHFLRHVQYQLAISFFRLSQHAAKLAQIAC